MENEFFDIVNSLLKDGIPNGRSSRAVAFIGASGIGKTFSAVSLPFRAAKRADQKGRNFLLAYIGFNIRFGLTDAETRRFDKPRGQGAGGRI